MYYRIIKIQKCQKIRERLRDVSNPMFRLIKPDKPAEASMDVPEEEIVPEADKDKEMEGFEDEDTSPGESIRKLFQE